MKKTMQILLPILAATIVLIGTTGCDKYITTKPELPPKNELTTPIDNKNEGLTPWEILKKHVTTKYPISEQYFDKHFKLTSVESGKDISDDSVLFPGVTFVSYTFSLTDPDNETSKHNLFAVIHDSYNNDVFDSMNKPAGMNKNEEMHYNEYSYNNLNPTKEINILVSKSKAIELAKANSECSAILDPDAEAPEKLISLQMPFAYAGDSGLMPVNETTWVIGPYAPETGLSSCNINPETGKVTATHWAKDYM
ncbi:MAG: hypothetical protein WC651_00010 [Candidatus Gracilibacteria bacterium]|jgi:hypothetical protein